MRVNRKGGAKVVISFQFFARIINKLEKTRENIRRYLTSPEAVKFSFSLSFKAEKRVSEEIFAL
ncbi:MAG: hypothetical protein LBV43_03530 [Prevotella sp.]|jgi:hypothetical protein|nr:hypothetical protein [Prevotella sp.]